MEFKAALANQYINTNGAGLPVAECIPGHSFGNRRPPHIVRQSSVVAPARKPVIARKFSREWYAGYASSAFSPDAPELEILDLDGKVIRIGWEQIKWVCYVRDLPGASENGGSANPERLIHKRFSIRPRTAGLWLRMVLSDGEELEGIAANDRSLIEGSGLMLVPPDTRSNTQRIYIPRPAIQSLEVVALIGAATRKRTATPERRAEQPELFPGESVTGGG
jgi:hypothetical protein